MLSYTAQTLGSVDFEGYHYPVNHSVCLAVPLKVFIFLVYLVIEMVIFLCMCICLHVCVSVGTCIYTSTRISEDNSCSVGGRTSSLLRQGLSGLEL